MDIAIFGKAKPCKDKKMDISIPSSIEQVDCCSNRSIVKKANDNLKKAQFELDTDNIVFSQTFFHTYIDLFEGLGLKADPFINYDPPLIAKDTLALYETYLL
jgi:hypothetical protein